MMRLVLLLTLLNLLQVVSGQGEGGSCTVMKDSCPKGMLYKEGADSLKCENANCDGWNDKQLCCKPAPMPVGTGDLKPKNRCEDSEHFGWFVAMVKQKIDEDWHTAGDKSEQEYVDKCLELYVSWQADLIAGEKKTGGTWKSSDGSIECDVECRKKSQFFRIVNHGDFVVCHFAFGKKITVLGIDGDFEDGTMPQAKRRDNGGWNDYISVTYTVDPEQECGHCSTFRCPPGKINTDFVAYKSKLSSELCCSPAEFCVEGKKYAHLKAESECERLPMIMHDTDYDVAYEEGVGGPWQAAGENLLPNCLKKDLELGSYCGWNAISDATGTEIRDTKRPYDFLKIAGFKLDSCPVIVDGVKGKYVFDVFYYKDNSPCEFAKCTTMQCGDGFVHRKDAASRVCDSWGAPWGCEGGEDWSNCCMTKPKPVTNYGTTPVGPTYNGNCANGYYATMHMTIADVDIDAIAYDVDQGAKRLFYAYLAGVQRFVLLNNDGTFVKRGHKKGNDDVDDTSADSLYSAYKKVNKHQTDNNLFSIKADSTLSCRNNGGNQVISGKAGVGQVVDKKDGGQVVTKEEKPKKKGCSTDIAEDYEGLRNKPAAGLTDTNHGDMVSLDQKSPRRHLQDVPQVELACNDGKWERAVGGCTKKGNANYNPKANFDDGTCQCHRELGLCAVYEKAGPIEANTVQITGSEAWSPQECLSVCHKEHSDKSGCQWKFNKGCYYVTDKKITDIIEPVTFIKHRVPDEICWILRHCTGRYYHHEESATGMYASFKAFLEGLIKRLRMTRH